MLDKRHSLSISMRGFGLIELMITISLLGILTTLAVDNFGTWIQDTKSRSVAESLQNGIRLAQTEAVKQSQKTSFILKGKNWTVQTTPRNISSSTTSQTIHNGAFADAGLVTISEKNKTSPTTQLTFNSIGRLTLPTSDVNYIVSNSHGKRRMQVSITIAGKIRMCDPDKNLSAANPDGVDANGSC